MLDLIINGSQFTGWVSAQITSTMETLSDECTVTVSQWDPGSEQVALLKPWSKAVVRYNGELLLTGYITKDDAKLGNGESWSITINDNTFDLVRACRLGGPFRWAKGQRVESILTQLCKPHGVNVLVRGNTGKPLDAVEMSQEETVYSMIQKLCKLRKLMARATPDGHLELFQSSARQRHPGKLIYGGDAPTLLDLQRTRDTSKQHSSVDVVGQSELSPERRGRAATKHRGRATNASVPRYIPLVMGADEQAEKDSCTTRAEWELSQLKAQALEYRVTVEGTHLAGARWRPNTLAHLDCPRLGVREDLLVSTVTHYFGKDTGTYSALTLKDKASYA